jgi:hypothetical protein
VIVGMVVICILAAMEGRWQRSVKTPIVRKRIFAMTIGSGAKLCIDANWHAWRFLLRC